MSDSNYLGSAAGRAFTLVLRQYILSAPQKLRPALLGILRYLQEPFRIGLTSVSAISPRITHGSNNSFTTLPVSWPVVGTTVDGIVLLHEGPLPTRVRWRLYHGIEAGFHLSPHSDQHIQHTLTELIDAATPRLIQARTRIALAMLHATLYYHKAVPPPQVRKILADFSNLGDFSENFSNNLESTGALEPIRLAVISPDKSARENFEKILEREIVKFQKNSEFPGEEGPEIELISATTFADVVVAIPPPHGWKPADIEALKKVHAHVGRLIIEDSFVTDSAESVLSRVVELASSAPANPDFFPFFKNGDSTGGPVVAASEQPLQPPQPGTKSGLYAGGIHGRMLISLRDPIARRACVRSLVRGPKVLVETVAVAVLIAVFGILLLTDMIGAGGFLGIGILAHRMYSRWYGLVRDWLIRHPEYDPDGRAQWISQTTKEHK